MGTTSGFPSMKSPLYVKGGLATASVPGPLGWSSSQLPCVHVQASKPTCWLTLGSTTRQKFKQANLCVG